MTGTTEDAEDAFGALIESALERLPEQVRERLGTVAIVVEDEPTRDQLDSVAAHGLFGLYVGVPRTAWGGSDAAIANKIVIFRGPLERAFGTGPRLADAVHDVVHHEIAHHLGISDARISELQGNRPPGARPGRP